MDVHLARDYVVQEGAMRGGEAGSDRPAPLTRRGSFISQANIKRLFKWKAK